MPAFQVYLIHTMSFLFMAVSFIAKMLETVALIFGLDHPLGLIRRAQATAIIISFSFFKYDFIQAHGLKTITLVYISFFNALSRTHTLNLITTLRAFSWILFIASDTNSIWLVQLWAQSIWSLLEYGYISITFIGRHGLLLIGHFLRLLLLNLWNTGLINVKALQHDAGTRLEQAISTIIGRVPVYFFGRFLGLDNFFNPWIPQQLLLLKFPHSMKTAPDKPHSSYISSIFPDTVTCLNVVDLVVERDGREQLYDSFSIFDSKGSLIQGLSSQMCLSMVNFVCGLR